MFSYLLYEITDITNIEKNKHLALSITIYQKYCYI